MWLYKTIQQKYYQKKFHIFFNKYIRLPRHKKLFFLYHFRDVFLEPFKKGLIDENQFPYNQWGFLTQLIADPDTLFKKIQVSVIIPAYNSEKYIHKCIDSILQCDNINFELIAVDDGSTDNTLQILQDYANKDKRVKVIHQMNSGAGTARNIGMKFAVGEYLLFLDSDDFFEPNMLTLPYKASFDNNTDITVWRCNLFIEKDNRFCEAKYTIRDELLPENNPFAGTDIKKDIFRLFIGWPWDKLFRTDFIKNNNLLFQEQRTTNDLVFVFSAVAKAQRIYTMDEILSHYRINEKGQSLSTSRERSWDCFYHALCALRNQLKDWGLYSRFEQDFINYSLHFSLWNLNTLKGFAFEQTYKSLKNEWFRELDISGKEQDYFYNHEEFENYCEIVQREPMDYLIYRYKLDPQRISNVVDMEDIIYRELETTQLKCRIDSLSNEVNAMYNSTTWKIGTFITYIPSVIKRRLLSSKLKLL